MDETANRTVVVSAQPQLDRAGAIRAAAVLEEPKHRRLITSPRHGQILSGLMRPGYTVGSVPSGHAVLTTTGRKTGKPRHKVIRAILEGDRVYIVQLRPPAVAVDTPLAVAAWVLNIRADPHVRLKLGRRTCAATMREIEDPAELARVRAIFCEPVHLVDYPECVIHLKGGPSARKIRDLHRYWFDTGVPLVAELQR
ncbi:MAG TPA: nitroreductase family deazaflavin-dependent oxidoreductase [Solirubrobacteraceae bacterium]|nr:nitroreductase family deazaflavin-dependent oxidoreductase [Solirubrobacteraceae bacterium]